MHGLARRHHRGAAQRQCAADQRHERIVAVERNQDVTDGEAFAQSLAAVRFLIGSEDYQEGLDAFVEKREPVWKGR